MRVPAGSQMGAPHAVTIAQREYALSRRLTLHADSRAAGNQAGSATICHVPHIRSRLLARARRRYGADQHHQPRHTACAASVCCGLSVRCGGALLVLCLSIVCVTVCLLLSVRVCLREQPKSVHVCMCIIVCQGVSFALLLSAPRVAASRRCVQFQSCRRLRKEAARCVVRQNSLSNSFQVTAHQCPHQPSIRCNRRRRAFRKLTEL